MLMLMTPTTPHCFSCALAEVCPHCSQTQSERGGGAATRPGRRKVSAGEALFAQGDAFHYLYTVRSGTFKSSAARADGRDQICGFPMVGDVIALDGLAAGVHATTSVALEDTHVCAISFATLETAMARDAALQRRISRLLSQEIVRGHRLMMLLGISNAHERLAAFLLDMSQRFASHGYSPQEFILRMTRAEIGSFLGLSIETVSRTLSDFQQRGSVIVDHRRVRIPDLAAFSGRYEALLQVG